MVKRARRAGRARARTLAFTYRRLFNLPPNDPRFLELTEEEMVTELVAWGVASRPGGVNAIEDEDEDFELEDAVAEINAQAEAEEAAEAEAAAAAADPGAWEDVEP